jgi:ketosteroid isomerase-like protein
MAGPIRNRDIVESFYEAVGEKEVHRERGVSKGDTGHLRRIFAEDIEWIHPALGGAFHGANSVIDDVLIPFWENWELSLDFQRFIEDGDTIVVLVTYRGTYNPTGNHFEEPSAHVWDLRDAKIVRFRQYIDTASLRAQIED